MLCDICKVQESRIHMEGEGQFCYDCHNARIARIHHIERLEHFAREIIVRDASGRPHHFEITNLLMPHFSEWAAEESPLGYFFNVMVEPDDDQEEALLKLHRKVITGLQHQTLELRDNRHFLSNALQTEDGQFTLKTTGIGRIEYDRDADFIKLILDGRPVSASEFFSMLSMYEGYNLLFQVREQSEDVFEKDMILVFSKKEEINQ